MKSKILFLFLILIFTLSAIAQHKSQIKIGRLKYSGGGDWYNDPSAETNLLEFAKKMLGSTQMLVTNL